MIAGKYTPFVRNIQRNQQTLKSADRLTPLRIVLSIVNPNGELTPGLRISDKLSRIVLVVIFRIAKRGDRTIRATEGRTVRANRAEQFGMSERNRQCALPACRESANRTTIAIGQSAIITIHVANYIFPDVIAPSFAITRRRWSMIDPVRTQPTEPVVVSRRHGNYHRLNSSVGNQLVHPPARIITRPLCMIAADARE